MYHNNEDKENASKRCFNGYKGLCAVNDATKGYYMI